MDEDYDYDIDYSADELYEYADGFPESMEYNLRDLWSDCLVPTLSDGIASTFKLLICCLLLKLNLALTFMPDYSFHFTSAATGIYCLHSFFGSDILYIILFAAVGYGIMILANDVLKQYQGTVCVFSCFMFAIICELFFAEKSLWHRIRGSQMLLSMKLISLAFDTQFSGNDLPPVIACFGFLFHPGTVIFGPWISYSSYMNSRQSIKVDFSWISSIIRSLIFSFGFLSISTCWTSWFFYSPGWKISSVVSALDIEIPRSLVEVVIWWNVPMHFWLKTYVFKTAKPLGDFAAVLLTYVASSLLHGLNFQLAAVLLSLGFYTYIEHGE
ncbi:protein-serine O-palmitoleoyltransferase porcupine-like [Uloborus diversus]|uniref:protein-serine O-palmitoleoyltransferase porcupine-like n=1 Tax=Uloborus diversus TaxID=327109 RepID=UPI00240A91E6|nr:protein-serine O-palmitoleoyltransferase porcupine-like [Uloborus diversus]